MFVIDCLCDVGTGKTHLGACIANAVLDSNRSVLFSSAMKLQAELKRSYDGKSETEREVIARYSVVQLLILDDIGKEPPTAWGLSRLFELVDLRNLEQRPIIVTSNYTPEMLVKKLTGHDGDATTARAIVDRLTQDCFLVELAGKSWREQHQNKNG